MLSLIPRGWFILICQFSRFECILKFLNPPGVMLGQIRAKFGPNRPNIFCVLFLAAGSYQKLSVVFSNEL